MSAQRDGSRPTHAEGEKSGTIPASTRFGIAEYLGAHAGQALLGLAMVAAAWPLLRAVGATRDAATLLDLLLALGLALLLLSGYLRERRCVEDLRRVADSGPDTLSLAAEVPHPGFAEGDGAVDALQATLLAANRLVSDSTSREADYRDFIETWVHETKTPLAAAELMVQNLGDDRLRPLSRELEQVNAYVEQALFYARGASLERDYLVRSCRVGELVRAALKSRMSQLIGAHVSVDLSGLACVDGPDGPTVYCDPKWLEFVLGQLLDNAVRYRCDPQTDGRAPRIRFDARVEDGGRAGETVVLSVTDNGSGIREADLGRVFDKGFTGANGRSRRRSTGIGLYLVATLCQKMGLDVGVDSEEGAWTRVDVLFPANRSRMVS
jgi:signal transduction histidine kinase